MRRQQIFLWAIVFILSLALVGIAYLGIFTRFLADDFCTAGSVIQLGLGGMLSQWYYNWTGRFSFIIVAGLFGLGGPKLAGWLPVFTISLWLFGSWWTLLPIIKRLNLSHPRLIGLITAGLLLLVLFCSVPNLYQSFYWQVGMVTYSLPLIVLTFSLGIILRYWLERTDLLFSCITLLILSFIGGGFDEAFSAMQVTLFTLSCLVASWNGRQSNAPAPFAGARYCLGRKPGRHGSCYHRTGKPSTFTNGRQPGGSPWVAENYHLFI